MKYITADEFIQKLNVELKEHADYKEGMTFLPYPEGTEGRDITGYIFKGSKNLLVFADVANKVDKQYKLKD